ncbi:MAG: (d)CMP kinase [Chitinophagales bacterium]|nr:(d)CMP kinase [Chitinophagales bacterium]
MTPIPHKINIAIDGHSGCGKSTTAKAVAQKLHYIYIDTGAMYRAITLFFIRNHIDLKDKKAVQEALSNISIGFKRESQSGQPNTYLNEENVEYDIRTPVVASKVSDVAAIEEVRKFLVDQQREIGKNKGVVMDGRDIGTVVFPDAECKFFITANADVRAERRLKELKENGIQDTLESVRENLLKRDEIDSNRTISPLKKAEDAHLIDTSYITIDEQVQEVLDVVRSYLNQHNSH